MQDTIEVHQAWIRTPRRSGGLGHVDMPLFSDVTREVSATYGVLNRSTGLCYRGYVILDPDGILQQARELFEQGTRGASLASHAPLDRRLAGDHQCQPDRQKRRGGPSPGPVAQVSSGVRQRLPGRLAAGERGLQARPQRPLLLRGALRRWHREGAADRAAGVGQGRGAEERGRGPPLHRQQPQGKPVLTIPPQPRCKGQGLRRSAVCELGQGSRPTPPWRLLQAVVEFYASWCPTCRKLSSVSHVLRRREDPHVQCLTQPVDAHPPRPCFRCSMTWSIATRARASPLAGSTWAPNGTRARGFERPLASRFSRPSGARRIDPGLSRTVD